MFSLNDLAVYYKKQLKRIYEMTQENVANPNSVDQEFLMIGFPEFAQKEILRIFPNNKFQFKEFAPFEEIKSHQRLFTFSDFLRQSSVKNSYHDFKSHIVKVIHIEFTNNGYSEDEMNEILIEAIKENII